MLNINERSAKKCLDSVKVCLGNGSTFAAHHPHPLTSFFQTLFAELDEVFADGRRYLFGDQMTSADITLASLGYLSIYYEDKGV